MVKELKCDGGFDIDNNVIYMILNNIKDKKQRELYRKGLKKENPIAYEEYIKWEKLQG